MCCFGGAPGNSAELDEVEVSTVVVMVVVGVTGVSAVKPPC